MSRGYLFNGRPPKIAFLYFKTMNSFFKKNAKELLARNTLPNPQSTDYKIAIAAAHTPASRK